VTGPAPWECPAEPLWCGRREGERSRRREVRRGTQAWAPARCSSHSGRSRPGMGGFLGLGLITGMVVTQARPGDVGTLADWTATVALVVVGRGLLPSRWWAGVGAWVTSLGLIVFGLYWAISGFGNGPTEPFQTPSRERVSRGPYSWCRALSSRPCCYRSHCARGFDARDESTTCPAITVSWWALEDLNL
jgi:hypothetical protein